MKTSPQGKYSQILLAYVRCMLVYAVSTTLLSLSFSLTQLDDKQNQSNLNDYFRAIRAMSNFDFDLCLIRVDF
jgi:hypothetical protein